MTAFPLLFSEVKLGNTRLKNRIVSTGHHTYLSDKKPNDALIAYHAARAAGGVGLIISEIVAVHETAAFSGQLLSASSADSITEFKRLAEACHEHGCKLFAQLFHPGREILSTKTGFSAIAYAPSTIPNERFHIMPKTMDIELIEDIIEGFALNAKHLAEAGFDGVEIVGSQGYLPAQFLNPQVNRRDDDYGGDFERRLYFVQQCVERIRQLAPGMTVGLRLSGDDMEPNGLNSDIIGEVCVALESQLDYFSVVAGSSATLGASVHITAPMGLDAAYVAPLSESIRQKISKPVIVTGRINQPQVAEQVIAQGQADLCGMTRALICDDQMPNKASANKLDDIRACIACNQACIGRAHKGLGISCIQHPESGRELQYPKRKKLDNGRKIMIVGGGPAGMKAAATAAELGHSVSLYEAGSLLGGQALLAQLLPGREEFGGLVTNLAREIELAGAEVIRNSLVTVEMVLQKNPDQLILATGAKPYFPDLENLDMSRVAGFDDILLGKIKAGKTVVIADWRADWTGIGLAEKLAREGCHVKLYTNAALVGESLQIYSRNHYVGRLYKLGVEMITHARLFGADDDTIFFQNTLSDEAMIVERVDTLVLSMGHQAVNDLHQQLTASGIDFDSIGDCVVPRTAEEAVYEGLTIISDKSEKH